MDNNQRSLIIGISGKKQAGKTTLCNNILKSFPAGSVEVYNFADVLKNLCVEIMGLKEEQVWGTDEEKNSLTNYEWERIPDFIKSKFNSEGKNISARHIMQILGTDVMRNMFDSNIWVNAVIRKIRKNNPLIAVIADVRFPSEVSFIEKENGIIIRLNRKLYEDSHPSETSLDEYSWSDNCIQVPSSLGIEDTYLYVIKNIVSYLNRDNIKINEEVKEIFKRIK